MTSSIQTNHYKTLRDYLASSPNTPVKVTSSNKTQIIQDIYNNISSPKFNGKITIEGNKFKLDKADYKALANITSQCLQTQPMNKKEVADMKLCIDNAATALKAKHLDSYFKEAQVRADFRDKAANISPNDDITKIYNDQIESLIKSEQDHKEKINNSIVNRKILSWVITGAAATVFLAGLVGGVAAITIIAAPALSIALAISLPALGLIGIGLGMWFNQKITTNIIEQEVKLKETDEKLKSIKNEQNLIKSEEFKAFQALNQLPKEKEMLFSEFVTLYTKTKELNDLKKQQELDNKRLTELQREQASLPVDKKDNLDKLEKILTEIEQINERNNNFSKFNNEVILLREKLGLS